MFPAQFKDGLKIMRFLNCVRKYESGKRDNWVHTFSTSVDLKEILSNQLQAWRNTPLKMITQDEALHTIAAKGLEIIGRSIISHSTVIPGIIEIQLGTESSSGVDILRICDQPDLLDTALNKVPSLTSETQRITLIVPELPAKVPATSLNVNILSLSDFLKAATEKLAIGQGDDMLYYLTPILSSLHDLVKNQTGQQISVQSLLLRSRLFTEIGDFVNAEIDLAKVKNLLLSLGDIAKNVTYHCELSNLRLKQLRSSEAHTYADEAIRIAKKERRDDLVPKACKMKVRACL